MSDRDTSASELVAREIARSDDVHRYLGYIDFRDRGTLFLHPYDWRDWVKHAAVVPWSLMKSDGRPLAMRDPSLPPGFGEWRLDPGTEAEVRLRFFIAWRCAGCGRRLEPAPEHPPFQFAARCGDCHGGEESAP